MSVYNDHAISFADWSYLPQLVKELLISIPSFLAGVRQLCLLAKLWLRIRVVHLMLASNNTVLMSMLLGGDMRSAECPTVADALANQSYVSSVRAECFVWLFWMEWIFNVIFISFLFFTLAQVMLLPPPVYVIANKYFFLWVTFTVICLSFKFYSSCNWLRAAVFGWMRVWSAKCENMTAEFMKNVTCTCCAKA